MDQDLETQRRMDQFRQQENLDVLAFLLAVENERLNEQLLICKVELEKNKKNILDRNVYDQQIYELDIEIRDVVSKLNSQTQENQRLLALLEEKDRLIGDLEDRVQKSQSSFYRMETVTVQTRQFQDNIQQLKNELAEKNRYIESIRVEIQNMDRLRDQIQDLKNERLNLQTIIQTHTTQITEIQQEKNNFERYLSEIKQLKMELQESNLRWSNCENENQRLQVRNTEIQKQCDEYYNRYNQLKVELENSENLKLTNEQLLTQISELKDKYHSIEIIRNNLQQQIVQYQTNISTLSITGGSNNQEDLGDYVVELDRIIEELKGELAEKDGFIQDIENRYLRIEHQNLELREELELLRGQNQQSLQRIEDLNRELMKKSNDLKSSMSNNQKELEYLKNENLRLNQERENLIRQIQSSEKNSQLIQRLQSEIMQLTEIRNQNEDQIALLTVENERLNAKIQILQNDTQGLIQKTEANYIEKLRALEEGYLRQIQQIKISIQSENDSQSKMIINKYQQQVDDLNYRLQESQSKNAQLERNLEELRKFSQTQQQEYDKTVQFWKQNSEKIEAQLITYQTTTVSQESVVRLNDQLTIIEERLSLLQQENTQLKTQLKNYHYFDTNYQSFLMKYVVVCAEVESLRALVTSKDTEIDDMRKNMIQKNSSLQKSHNINNQEISYQTVVYQQNSPVEHQKSGISVLQSTQSPIRTITGQSLTRQQVKYIPTTTSQDGFYHDQQVVKQILGYN